MFSSTVRSKNSERSSGTCASPRRGIRCGRVPSTTSPSTSTLPASGASRPDRVSSVVVLPAPFGPSSATTSPGPDREVEVAHDGDAAVAGVQTLHVDQPVGHVVVSEGTAAWANDRPCAAWVSPADSPR